VSGQSRTFSLTSKAINLNWGLTPFANCYSVLKDRYDLLI